MQGVDGCGIPGMFESHQEEDVGELVIKRV